jgi:hypothetical protein
MAKLDQPLAVQILKSTNIGMPMKEQDEEDEGIDDDDERKFENKYLDPSLLKEKKKIVKEANRMMKLSLTDGLNKLDAIEYERFKLMDYFGIG